MTEASIMVPDGTVMFSHKALSSLLIHARYALAARKQGDLRFFTPADQEAMDVIDMLQVLDPSLERIRPMQGEL